MRKFASRSEAVSAAIKAGLKNYNPRLLGYSWVIVLRDGSYWNGYQVVG